MVLVQRLANILAFEPRCIRSSLVAQVRRTLPVRLHLRALLARRIDALDASGYSRDAAPPWRIGLLCGALLLAAACADPARERFERAEKELLSQKMEEALADYRFIARDHPQSRYAPVALLRQGELYGSYYRNFPAALEAYESLVYNYPKASEVPSAILRTAEIHLLQYLDPSTAALDLERIRKEFPRFAGEDEVLFLLARAYGAAGEEERQAAALVELIERFPKSNRAAAGRWMLAYAFLGQRRYADADREFRKLLYLSTTREST
ncbi:MAG: tetratricopeptide repeat protein, partial [Deltaproteobacteria bacterium]|nr:tetratricopeptide repeat protein [Deltaproteobacteria bacterium]